MSYLELVAQFEELKAAHQAIFPNSYMSFSKPCLGEGCFFIGLMLQHPSDCANKIEHNDPMRTILSIYEQADGKFSLELVDGSSLSVNPTVPHMAMSRVKCPFRKSTGDKDKIVKAFTNYLLKRKECIKTNKADIYHVNRIDPKYILGM